MLSLLTVGIGGATAIFSAFNALYLRPLPFHNPARLVNLDETAPQWNLERVGIAYPEFDAWREHNQAFRSMAVFQDTMAQVSDDSYGETRPAAQATHDLARVLEIQPAVGPWFLPEDDQPGARRVVVLSYLLWQARFGCGAAAMGQTIRINAQPHTYSLRAWYVGTLQRATTILLGAVALVLLIACINIAGIMRARGAARMREIGICAALGAALSNSAPASHGKPAARQSRRNPAGAGAKLRSASH